MKESKTKYWRCPMCSLEVTTHVGIIGSPECGSKSHSTKRVAMEQVKKLISV
jgi:hypothetical protein